MDVRAYNRRIWDQNVEEKNCWTLPVSSELITRAREGRFDILLTPTKPTPMSWFPDLQGTSALCLASGGGQQGPLLAAAGADVTVLDNSPRQLDQDAMVAERDGLEICTVEGDMADLSLFTDGAFDLIVHPCSNCFVPDVHPVWRECFRVLRSGGSLLSGLCNPVRFLFEDSRLDNGVLTARYKIPYSDHEQLSQEQLQELVLDKNEPLEFSHTLADLIGGQLEAGFLLAELFEDRYEEKYLDEDPISHFMDTFIATRALKP